jgi:hypothetical protein
METVMKNRITLIIVSLLIFSGCRSASAPSQQPPSSDASPDAQIGDPVGGTTPASETKYFKGSIGSSLDLQMKLVRTGDQLSGSYFYQNVGTRIDLRGRVDKEGNLTLEEFDQSGKQTGVFKGIWKLDAQNGLVSLAGNWSKPPGEAGSDRKTAFSVHEEPITFTAADVDLTTKQIKQSNKKQKYEVTAQYPHLSGGANPNFEKFNQAVRSLVFKRVADFRREKAAEEEDVPQPEGSGGSELGISYAVTLAQDDLVSVEFVVYSYLAGAAHPNSFTETINYDLKNGKQLKLSDLFKPGAKYLPTLATYSIADLKKQMKEKSPDGSVDSRWIEEGAGPAAKNYESWTIRKKGLGINFNPYQVGPYAAGPHFVMVPYSTLKDLINPDGPIAQFEKGL